MSEPEIGDCYCFVAKDPWIRSGYKAVGVLIENDDDLLMIDNYFNDQQFVMAFKDFSIEEATRKANNFIIDQQKNNKISHAPFQEAPPGQNSYIVDKREDTPEHLKHIKLVPKR